MNSRTRSEEELIRQSVADEAGSWDARLRAPDCTDADRARFAAWRDANPSHRAAFEKMQTIVATLHHNRSRADVRALRNEALRAMDRLRRRRVWSVAAAAGLVAFGIALTLWRSAGGDWLRSPLSDLAARLTGTEIYTTGTGQRSTFTLEDGSTVELNARSRVHVDYSESERRVELVKGQVLFSVAKHSRRPFIVRAGNRNIVAVGTQFDVRLDSDSVQVTLIEGKVRIERHAPRSAVPDSNSALQSDEFLLTPGKQLVAKLSPPPLSPERRVRPRNAGNQVLPQEPARRAGEALSDVVVRAIDVTKVTGWRNSRVFLDNLTLAEAVTEMNRYSLVQIAVADPQLAQRRINGMFKAGEQEAFVAALEEYFPVAVEHRGARQIILTTRR